MGCLTDAEMKAQATRCSCHGANDLCPCQNTPDATTMSERTVLAAWRKHLKEIEIAETRRKLIEFGYKG